MSGSTGNQKILNPNPDITVEKLGEVDVIIVDNFLQDPVALREYGISSMKEYQENPMSGKYRFFETRKTYELHPHPAMFEKKFPGLCAGIARLCFDYIAPGVRDYYQLGPAAKSIQLRKGPYFHAVHQSPIFTPHVDDGHISTFMYLNTPDTCWGGTAIYRHVPTGIITSNQRGAGLDWLLTRPMTENLVESTDEWKLELKVDMKFNRFVAFNSATIHKIFWPGDDAPYRREIAESRLALNNFFMMVGPGAGR